jgi:class 3 adenylate cyclase
MLSWRVKAVDAKESWKITIREASHVSETSTPKLRNGVKCPFTGAEIHQDVNPVIPESTESTCHEPFISGQQMKSIFPYHIVFDQLFVILQIGSALPGLMNVKESDLVGCHMEDILCITKPVLGTWDWKALKKLEDQTFFLEPVHDSLGFVKFKANVVRLSDPSGSAMLFLSPDVKNVHEMNAMNLTMTDLPLHSFQRDAVLLGEHIVSEVKSSHKLDRLSKKLQHEQTLSNALLHSVLPPHVAGELRAGKTVDPELHDEVTLFFSDVVGFTSICENIFPWDCVDLLNRLYCVMDFLAGRFKLYKIETIGDSYLCCAGLPTADPKHAERVANFALAVRHCSQLVMNPVDGLPIQLRIGLHSGPCMTGVVGMTTPRYCVFGDTVNTASRHESTGIPGKIQCSSITYGKLAHFSEGRYEFTPRGLVEMKGKGLMATYFLEGSDNTQVSSAALDQLYSEVENMLANRKFSNKRYFKRYGRRASETCFGTTESNTSETLDQSQEEE